MDMSTQTFIEHFFAYFLSLFVNKHPISKLAVPAQTVSTKGDVVFTTKIGNLIRIFPIELSFFGLQRYGFHIVFGSDAIEILFNQCDLIRIGHITHIHCYTYGKVVFISILVPCRVFYRLTATKSLRRNTTGCRQHSQRHTRNYNKFFHGSLYFMVYLNKCGTNSLKQRRQVSHSWAVPCDS